MQRYIKYRNNSIDKPNTTKRDYKLEQKFYKSSALYQEAQRNRAKNRYLLKKLGLINTGDGSQIHHKNGNPFDNRLQNLVVVRSQCSHNRLHGKRCKKSARSKKK